MIKIGILGAMPEEVDDTVAFYTQHAHSHETLTIGSRDYICCYFKAYQVIIAFSRWGKVASASTVTTMINHFNIDCLLFSGLAGGTLPSVNVGDIVVGDRFVQHDMDPRPLLPRFEIPLTETMYLASHHPLVNLAYETVVNVVNNHSVMAELPLQSFTTQPLRVYKATIACGDQFMDDGAAVNELVSVIDNLHAVDMESGAIAQVCDDYGIPFVIVRIISDKADADAPTDCPRFCREISRPFNRVMVNALVDAITNQPNVLITKDQN